MPLVRWKEIRYVCTWGMPNCAHRGSLWASVPRGFPLFCRSSRVLSPVAASSIHVSSKNLNSIRKKRNRQRYRYTIAISIIGKTLEILLILAKSNVIFMIILNLLILYTVDIQFCEVLFNKIWSITIFVVIKKKQKKHAVANRKRKKLT